ncbi:MAG: hypothetical protein K9L19_06115 [Desulfarculaceae bacterium]|nr:hypothetical protein [Desulfarculaceae bacterium]
MPLVIDTDAFCKLSVAGLLQEAVEFFGVGLHECFRLPALPHMLIRGGLVRKFGREACEAMAPDATAMLVLPKPSDTWLDLMTPIDAIDPGEAQIIAAAAESDLMILTGDKRALLALIDIEGIANVLGGRIVVLEAILLALCDSLGADEVRRRVVELVPRDTMFRICFSATDQPPQKCLQSYYDDLAAKLGAIRLWNPRGGGET